MRGEGGVAGGRLGGEQKFHSWGRVHHDINKYPLGLDVRQSFITWIFCIFKCEVLESCTGV